MKLALTSTICLALVAWPGAMLAAESIADMETRHSQSVGDFARMSQELGLSEAKQKEIAAEIANIRKDNASITAALIQSAKTEKKLSEDVATMEERLAALEGDRSMVKASLGERRGVLAEVLGALQRMGRNPPPAILVKPEDALSSVRSAILLGAVVPELRHQTDVLLADLSELARLGETINSERDRLVKTIAQQSSERGRLSLLLDEKKRVQEQSEARLSEEKDRSEKMAQRAKSLKDLIASLEKDIDQQRKAEEASRKREALRAAAPVPEVNRLTAAPPFEALRGQLSIPVSGRLSAQFGQSDRSGVATFGDTVKTQSGAIVTAPSDATVLYAGPFRSYGQLLILDAGGGYHIVLAGLGKISVSQGQPVLSGEPVGSMGVTRLASALTENSETPPPELYIEFRKDQKPVDPTPWWKRRQAGRTGNDS
ncbi:MAG: murein hydrolase activator EnvC [Mesorhizobium sp.]